MTESTPTKKLTPLQLRAKLEQMVRQDLLGPQDGPEEEIRGRRVSVRGRYVVGLLAPRGQSLLPDEGLPIVVVDEEVYRRLPTLLIATVDKFAQMPWKGETGMLFGQVDGYCPRHGYRSPKVQDSDSHPKKRNLPAARTQPTGPLRPPDLIIQDEGPGF
jgi:hypothetical protein